MDKPINTQEAENKEAQSSTFFITICTQEKEMHFGAIVKGKMHLSEIGELAAKYWKEISKHYNYVKADTFVVMPNHIHGIITINKPGNQKENLSAIIGSYKSVVLNAAKPIVWKFAWQSKFDNQLIKDKESEAKIAEYISSNISKWRQDKFYRS
jgi:putative transposase